MENQSPLPEDPDARIKALLARMEADDRVETRKSLGDQRKAWQKAWFLRYVIGPFMAGQLFDLWQWVLSKVDHYLWDWAQEPVSSTMQPSTPSDPRAALRQALEKKRDDKPSKPSE